MATHNINDVNLQPVEVALLLNQERRSAYEAAVRAQNLGLDAQNFTDRDKGLYADTHRSQNANL